MEMYLHSYSRRLVNNTIIAHKYFKMSINFSIYYSFISRIHPYIFIDLYIILIFFADALHLFTYYYEYLFYI